MSMEKRMRQTFRELDVTVNGEALEKLQEMAGEELPGRQREKNMSFGRFLLTQIRSIGWKIWLAQGGILAAEVCGLCSLQQSFGWNGRLIACYLCLCALLMFLASVPVLRRGLRYGMHEIEATAHFSWRRVLLAKLLILGMGDGVLLGGMGILALSLTKLGQGGVCLALFMPFLGASLGGMFLLGRLPGEAFAPGCVGIAVLTALLTGMAAISCPEWILAELTWVGAIVLVFLGAALIWQIRYLLVRSAYGELQLR